MLWIETPSCQVVRADAITEARPHELHTQMRAGTSWRILAGIGSAEDNEVVLGSCRDQEHARQLILQLIELINLGGDGVLRLGDDGFERSDFTRR